MDYYKSIPILDTERVTDFSHPTGVTFGLVPRDYSVDPQSMFESPTQLQLIPESEWDARFDEQEATESSLEHLYLRGGQPAFENLDQNGDGYCWAYSVGHAMMIDRLKANLPLVRLNPHATAAIIKNGRDEGGWCGLSGKWAKEHGYAVEGDGPGHWPLHSRDTRNDTPELRAAMAKHRVTEDWYDLTRQEWDQTLTQSHLTTLSFLNVPCPSDFPWWSHSVLQMRKVRIERGSWGTLILNSWKGWGRFGLAVLRGSQAIAGGAIAIRSSIASVS